jgi:hypothetical protein
MNGGRLGRGGKTRTLFLLGGAEELADAGDVG